MWKIEDFWKIFNYLKYDKKSDLYDPIKALAKSEESKSIALFENTLDQLSFNNEHYNRLREFLITWYSSAKSLTASQKSISDLYGMPDTHLDELFRSKGFNFSTYLSKYGTDVNYNKVNFYYDLVNLYKYKGSPRTMLNVLTYFGFPNIEILEYYTYVRRSTQRVEFHSTSADHSGDWQESLPDILSYDEATAWDPRYMTSEQSIINGKNNNKLSLPKKSPYFSFRQFVNLNEYVKLMSFLSRKIQDQYKEWQESILTNIIDLPDEVYINSCTMDTSVLELYLACVYTYYKHFGTEITLQHPTDSVYDTTIKLGNHGRDYLCYDGTDASYINILHDFEDYIENVPLTRDEIKEKQAYFYDQFSRLTSGNFLKNENSAGIILRAINPTLYGMINELYDIKPETIILGDLLEDLMKWINSYASIALPNLNFVLFGTEEFKRILFDLINFFKPYHARMIGYDMIFVNDDRNTESVIVEDDLYDIIAENIHDWDTCNSKPCCNDTCSNTTPDNFYSRDTYDCGSYYDIGGACDAGRDNSFITEIEDNINDPLNCLQGHTVLTNYENPAHPDYHKDIYVETERIALPDEFVPAENIGETVSAYESQSGNFMSFDDGGCFDGQYGSDVCQIQIIDSP